MIFERMTAATCQQQHSDFPHTTPLQLMAPKARPGAHRNNIIKKKPAAKPRKKKDSSTSSTDRRSSKTTSSSIKTITINGVTYMCDFSTEAKVRTALCKALDIALRQHQINILGTATALTRQNFQKPKGQSIPLHDSDLSNSIPQLQFLGIHILAAKTAEFIHEKSEMSLHQRKMTDIRHELKAIQCRHIVGKIPVRFIKKMQTIHIRRLRPAFALDDFKLCYWPSKISSSGQQCKYLPLRMDTNHISEPLCPVFKPVKDHGFQMVHHMSTARGYERLNFHYNALDDLGKEVFSFLLSQMLHQSKMQDDKHTIIRRSALLWGFHLTFVDTAPTKLLASSCIIVYFAINFRTYKNKLLPFYMPDLAWQTRRLPVQGHLGKLTEHQTEEP